VKTKPAWTRDGDAAEQSKNAEAIRRARARPIRGVIARRSPRL
jgi:hypothetical protein